MSPSVPPFQLLPAFLPTDLGVGVAGKGGLLQCQLACRGSQRPLGLYVRRLERNTCPKGKPKRSPFTTHCPAKIQAL